MTFQHGTDQGDDDKLEAEAKAYRDKTASVQLVEAALGQIRAAGNKLTSWPPSSRVGSFAAWLDQLSQRPDIRADIVGKLTGMTPAIARPMEPKMQAALIQSARDTKMRTDEEIEAAFQPRDLAIYGDHLGIFQELITRLPWPDSTQTARDIVRFVLEQLVLPRPCLNNAPIFTPWHVLRAIDPAAIAHHLSEDVFATFYTEWLGTQGTGQHLTPAQAMDKVFTVEVLVKQLPLAELRPVLDGALKHMRGEPTGASIVPGGKRQSVAPPAMPGKASPSVAPAPAATNGNGNGKPAEMRKSVPPGTTPPAPPDSGSTKTEAALPKA